MKGAPFGQALALIVNIRLGLKGWSGSSLFSLFV
jgi:hypothetical protein